jgi:hypothetical protein
MNFFRLSYNPSRRLLVLLMLLGILGIGSVQARNISWGSQPFDNLFDSTGSALDSTFTFEIGTFESGFTPTFENRVYWADNWKVFDQATNGDGWNPGAQFFSSVANLKADGTSQSSPPLPANTFAENDIGYMWIYNSLTFDPASEWALITNTSGDANSADDWLFPDPADQSNPTSVFWNLLNASETVTGGLNNVQGDGSYTATPGTFSLQTSVVPEPGSALLIAAAGLLLRLHRGRRGRGQPRVR